MDIEIGRAKRGRRAYSFDDIAIVPSRRTRDPEEVSVAWQIDAYRFEHPGAGRADGLGDVARHRDRASARPAGSACSTSRACGPGTTTRCRCSQEVGRAARPRRDRRLQEIYARADPARPDVPAGQGDARGRRHRRRRAVAAADQGVRPVGDRRRARPVRHPRHHGLGRARVGPGRAAQPQAVHLRARRAGHRRRLRDPPGRAAPDAHRRGRRARRLRRRRGAHHPHRARARRADGDGGRRRGGRPARLPRRVRRSLRARHRRRLDRPERRHRQGDRLRRRRRDGRLAAGPRQRGARRRLPLGRRGPARSRCRAASASRSAPSARSSRSCTARRSSPTAR